MTLDINLFKEILEKALDAIWVVNEFDTIDYLNPCKNHLNYHWH